LGFSLVNGAPPKESPLVDARGRVTSPWFAFLTTLQKSNSGVVVGLGGINLNGQTLTGSATFSGPVVFATAPSFSDAAGTRSNLGLGSAALQPSSAFDAAGAASAAIASSLQRANNLSDIVNAATARANIGAAGTAVSNTFTLSQNISAASAISLSVTGNLSTGFGGVAMAADGAPVLNARTYGSVATTALGGITLATWSVLYHNSGAGLLIETANASPLVFGTSNVERARFVAAGRFLLGTTTDDGSSALQVAGAAYVKGSSLTLSNSFAAGAAGYLLLQSAPVSPYSGRLQFGTDGSGWQFAITKNQGGTLTDVCTFKDDLSVNVAGRLNAASLGATSLAGTLNLNSQALSGATLGTMNIGRAATFASAAVIWGLNILNASAGDSLVLGQSSATYSGGAIAWIGSSNSFLYFNSGQDFRIGSGVGSTPIATFKGAGRVLIGSLTDDGANILQVTGGVAFNSPSSLAFGSGWISWTPAVTASGTMTITALTITDAQYLRLGPFVFFKIYASYTLGGTASTMLTFALPVNAAGQTSTCVCSIYDPTAATWSAGFGMIDTTSNLFRAYRTGQVNYNLGSGFILLEGFYRCT
jgi:hypothetical protein